MEKEHRHGQPPVGLGALGIGGVGRRVHVPAVGAEEARAFQSGGVAVLVGQGQHAVVPRQVGGRLAGAEPATVGADSRGDRRLALAGRTAGPEQRLHRRPRVGLEGGARRGEILPVEQLVVPLRRRELRFRIDRPIGQWDDAFRAETLGDVGHAEIGDAVAAVGVLLGQRPHRRCAPVVADPDRLGRAKVVQQLDQVGDDLLQGVILVPAVEAGAAVAAHVRRDRPQAEIGEHRQLVAPGGRQLRPAVHEDHRRRARVAAGQVETGVPGALGDMF